MAGFKLGLALSFVILLLLSEGVSSAFQTRKIGVHVKKFNGGGGSHASGGGGGHAGGGSHAGGGGYVGSGGSGYKGDGAHMGIGGVSNGGHVKPGGGANRHRGTQRSSAIGTRPSLPLASAVRSSLLLGLLFLLQL
ncbi:dormancy-associated protein 2-like [Eucalyptus grandis]|uniref:dormancy-associated protein 2-like n=1 Tax=Eucalyptus grandis TaxID=71139 RepID=UPI00192EDA00|nr:dormancy-associated protein 2-like [Eucalyptus grandis]